MSITEFQTATSMYPAPGKPGTWASINPYRSVPSFEGQFLAGANCILATFGWADPTDASGRSILSSSATAVVPLGLIPVSGNVGLIMSVLEGASMQLPIGFGVTLIESGDWWMQPTGIVTPGQRVFARLADGTVSGGAAGATIAGMIETPWYWSSATGAAGDVAVISRH